MISYSKCNIRNIQEGFPEENITIGCINEEHIYTSLLSVGHGVC